MISKPSPEPERLVRAIYRKLARSWGPQHWWPAESAFEVIVGAILTQNTSWTNVERAMANLRAAGLLHLDGIRMVPLDRLEELIRSSGYYRQKAERLKSFVHFVDKRHNGSLEKMFDVPTNELRTELLSLKGIGHETADAILLYAGNHEIFVVDAYARRILERHRAVQTSSKYDEIRNLVEEALKTEIRRTKVAGKSVLPSQLKIHEPSVMSRANRSPMAQAFNEMHGLLVQVGKHYCRKQEPRCEECPLRSLLPDDGPASTSS